MNRTVFHLRPASGWPSFLLFTVICFGLWFPTIVWSQSTGESETQQSGTQQSGTRILAQQILSVPKQRDEWLALLHFSEAGLFGTAKSYITTPSFFLSDVGAADPEAELAETLSQLARSQAAGDDHPVCLFPARAQWIEHVTQVQVDTPECPGFEQWLAIDQIRSISMVFASGHFKNPASFFGHNFLKLNAGQGDDLLLDRSINFGAVIDPGENPLLYLVKGMTGQYDASYSIEPFYRLLSKYGEKDLRDVWEYELDLDARQLQLLVAHLWEIRDVVLPYYFFRENCAYQISALLNTFTDTAFVPRYLPWAMPISVFDRMMEATIDGRNLVREVRYFQSRRSAFQIRYAQSTAAEKALMKEFASGQLLVNLPSYQQLTHDRKLWIIDALNDYTAYRAQDDPTPEIDAQKRQLLQLRLSLASGKQTRYDITPPVQPHKGQKPTYVSLGVTHQENLVDTTRDLDGASGYLRLRPANYDYMSLIVGQRPIATFALLDTTLSLETGALLAFDAFDISNLNANFTRIGNDRALSWRVRLGRHPLSDECNDCDAWLFDWTVGQSYSLADSITGFVLAGVRVQENRQRRGLGGLQAQVGVSGLVTPYWRVHATATWHEQFNNNQPFQTEWSVEQRFGRSRTHDFRLKVTKRDALRLEGSVGFYW